MRKRIYGFVITVAVVIVSATGLTGCSGDKSVELGPVETLEAFCKAVTAGEWTEAESLCDTLTMKNYLDGHQQIWEKLQSMGIQSELHTYATRGHCFQKKASPGTGSYTFMDRIWEFLTAKGFNR